MQHLRHAAGTRGHRGPVQIALSRIPKVIKKFAERLLALASARPTGISSASRPSCSSRPPTRSARWSASCATGRTWTRSRSRTHRLHRYEGEADKLMLELLRDLYSGEYEPLQMIVHPRPLRAAGEGHRPLPRRRQRRLPDRAEELLSRSDDR